MQSAAEPTITAVEECEHKNRVTTTSVGLERETCLDCGHINFRYVFHYLETKTELAEEHAG